MQLMRIQKAQDQNASIFSLFELNSEGIPTQTGLDHLKNEDKCFQNAFFNVWFKHDKC